MTLDGIDVSQWQGAIDWNAVAASGIQYAWAKVSEGVGFEDPLWAQNAGPLAAPGPIVPGAYHFARPDLGNSPEAEANWFWTTLTKRVNPTGWLLSLDLEVGNGPLGDWRDRFCTELSRLAQGYVPGWYSFANFIGTHALNYPTTFWGWLAWPDSNGPLPSTNFSVSFQQYGSRSVPSIGGQVDADRFFGSRDQLQALTLGGIPAGPGRDGDNMAITAADLPDDVLVVQFQLIQESLWGFVDPNGQQDFINAIRAGKPMNAIADGWRGLPAATAWSEAKANLLANQGQSVPGPAGPAGPQGPAGVQGPQGEPGPAVGDDHIASVALGAVSKATTPPTS